MYVGSGMVAGSRCAASRSAYVAASGCGEVPSVTQVTLGDGRLNRISRQ
jgi:hypothetical protein